MHFITSIARGTTTGVWPHYNDITWGLTHWPLAEVVVILKEVSMTTCFGFTHWGRATHMCVSKQGHNWFRQWLVAWSMPGHYLTQCWNFVNWTLGNKLQWNFNRNSNFFIQENAFESVICEMAAILSRPQWVKLISYAISIPENTFNKSSLVVQVMAWCRQTTSHYLNQCWLKSMSSYGIIRPQWVNVTQITKTPLFVEKTIQVNNKEITTFHFIGLLWG